MNKFESTVANLRQAGYVPVPCIGKGCFLKPSWTERDEFTDAEWSRADNIAVRTGKQSDDSYLSCIDLDSKDDEVLSLAKEAIRKHVFDVSIYFEESPHGYHIFFKTPDQVYSSKKMYVREDKPKDAEGRAKEDIELKAGNALVRIYPCEGFKVIEGGLERLALTPSDVFKSIVDELTNIKTPEARKVLLSQPSVFSDRPTDYLNANPASYLEFLQSQRWEVIGESDERWNLKRPGSEGLNNIGITVAKKDGMTHAFSSKLNTLANTSVSPTNFIANEFFNGDFNEACRLVRETMMPAEVPADFIVNFDQINERMKMAEEKPVSAAHWSSSIEAAIAYGSAHKDEMKMKLPPEIYNSSARIREMVDYISDRDNGCRIGSFAAAWTAAGMVCGRKVIERHSQDNKIMQCSTAQYTFAFAPSGCGKSAGEGLIKMICDEYNKPLYALEKDREEGEEEAYKAARILWEKADKESRGPAPEEPKKARWYKRMFNQAASSQALFEDLANRTDGKVLICVDEARDYLNAITNRYAKQYLSDIRTTYKKAFTSELGEIVNETSLSQRGKGGKNSEYCIRHPSISAYYSGVSPASWDEYADCVEDGTFGRFNFFFFDDDSENIIVCSNSREERFDWKEDSIKSWVRNWAMRGDEQLVEWTDGALKKLSKFLMEVRTEKRKWAPKNPLFADCVAHSPLRFAKAALLYAVLDKGEEEDLRVARIDEKACEKAYVFMMYQFASLMNVFNLSEGMQESDIIRALREYTKGICDDNGWFTKKALLASGFSWRGWSTNLAAGKLLEMCEKKQGIEWNQKKGKYMAFRILPDDE